MRFLDLEFFRVHYQMAEYYSGHITRRRGWLIAWLLGVFARQSPHPIRTTLDTSGSRLHDREENLQAASDKIGGHLFEKHIRLIAQARPEAGQLAAARPLASHEPRAGRNTAVAEGATGGRLRSERLACR